MHQRGAEPENPICAAPLIKRNFPARFAIFMAP